MYLWIRGVMYLWIRGVVSCVGRFVVMVGMSDAQAVTQAARGAAAVEWSASLPPCVRRSVVIGRVRRASALAVGCISDVRFAHLSRFLMFDDDTNSIISESAKRRKGQSRTDNSWANTLPERREKSEARKTERKAYVRNGGASPFQLERSLEVYTRKTATRRARLDS